MKKILFGIVLVILSSCGVDKTDINKVGPIIIDHLISDTLEAKKYFAHNGDSLSENTNEIFKKISIIKSPNYNIIKYDTIISSYFDNTGWADKYHFFDSYIKNKDGDFFQIYFIYERDSVTNDIILPGALGFNNISELCNKDKDKIYCPKNDITFKNISWTTDYYGKTLKSGTISFQNNTKNDLNYIKFRVILKNGNSIWSAETFFNQTVESYKPSYKGDITTVEIPGMENYFVGFKVEKDRLFFDAELIEVAPKPVSEWCEKIRELKDEIIKKSE